MNCYDHSSECQSCPVSKCEKRLEPYYDAKFSCDGNCYECKKAYMWPVGRGFKTVKVIQECEAYNSQKIFAGFKIYGRTGKIVRNSAIEEAMFQFERCQSCEYPFKSVIKRIKDINSCKKKIAKIEGVDLNAIVKQLSKINPIEGCQVKKDVEKIIKIQLTKENGKTVIEICNLIKNIVKNGYFVHEITIKPILDSMIKEGIVIRKKNVYYLA